MDRIDQKQEGNPFFVWAVRYGNKGDRIYVPDISVLPIVMKKWNLKASDFPPYLGPEVPYWGIYIDVIQSIVEYWSDPFIKYDLRTKTVTVDKTSVKVVGSAEIKDRYVYFIKGWVCTPELTTLLLRTVRKKSGNEENPFNVLRKKSKPDYKCFPDMVYIPQLLKEVGMESFEELNLIQTGDWPALWENVRFSGFSQRGTIADFSFEGEKESLHVLWRDNSSLPHIFYVSKLPKIVVERLKAVVVHNKGKMPSKSWTKDTFKTMTDNLRGKDLISLCFSNKDFGEFCWANKQALFKTRLMQEFGIDYKKNEHDHGSPYALYRQLHIYYMYVRLESKATNIDESDIYALEKISERGREAAPVSERIVTFVPEEGIRKGFDVYVIFFPSVPEISYFVLCKNVDGRIVVKSAHETKGIRTILKNEEILSSAQTLIDVYDLESDSDLLSIPEYDSVDVSWYENISGDRDIRVLK